VDKQATSHLLQPLTLAAFRPWGSSVGADRIVAYPMTKVEKSCYAPNLLGNFFCEFSGVFSQAIYIQRNNFSKKMHFFLKPNVSLPSGM